MENQQANTESNATEHGDKQIHSTGFVYTGTYQDRDFNDWHFLTKGHSSKCETKKRPHIEL